MNEINKTDSTLLHKKAEELLKKKLTNPSIHLRINPSEADTLKLGLPKSPLF